MRLLTWYVGLLAALPLILMGTFSFVVSHFQTSDRLDIIFTYYCMPVTFLLGGTGGGHFYMHAGIFPADLVGWASVFLFWFTLAIVVAIIHRAISDRGRRA